MKISCRLNFKPLISLGVCLGISAACLRAAADESIVNSTDGEIRRWTALDGLPADSVTAIIQTQDGYLWVGTAAGLVRFDGLEFTPFTLQSDETNGTVRITALCEDSAGNLWVGTQQHGLFKQPAHASGEFSRSEISFENSINCLAADASGNLWIGTRSGLIRWNGRTIVAYTSREGLADPVVTGLHVARSGAVWIATRSGMFRHLDGQIQPYAFETDSQGRSPEFLGAYEDRRGNLWAFGDTYLINLAEGKRFNYFRGADAGSVRIWSLCEGRDGRLWIGTSGRGLFCFDDNKFQPVTLSELRWPHDVRAIHEDREGNLWLGTSGGGLMQLRPQSTQIVRVDQGLPPGGANSLALNAQGRIYAGMEKGGVFVGEAGRFERFNLGSGADLNSIASAAWFASDGTLWTGTLGNGLYGIKDGRALHFTTANGLGDDHVLSVCADRKGDIWIGTRAGTLHQFDGRQLINRYQSNHQPLGAIIVLSPASNGSVWLGTQDGMLFNSGEAEKFLLPLEWPLAGRAVLSVYETSDSTLWVGTDGGGLAVRLGQRWRVWTTTNGLPHDIVAGICDDKEGNVWLALGDGIYRVPQNGIRSAILEGGSLGAQRVFNSRTTGSRFPGVGGPRIVRSPEGKLWIATAQGVLSINAGGAQSEIPPVPVYVESILVNGIPYGAHRVSHTSKDSKKKSFVRLSMDVRTLEFDFTAIHFTAPEELRFRHKLEGFDADWVNDRAERRGRYGRLPYGEYRFRVAAQIAQGQWIEAASPFAFVVPTPVYLRAWALVSYVVIVIATVVVTVRVVSHRRLRRALIQMEQQRSLERERMRIAQDMHDEIGSKLTKISFLSEHAKVSAPAGPLASRIESIATTSRELLQTLDEIVWAVNPRNDNLEHLAAYLAQYATEYFQNTTVQCELRLPRQLPDHPLSAETRHNLFLSFEEALNNVLKHANATKVRIEMSVVPSGFEINISDDGKGIAARADAAASRPRNGRIGNGLLNMRERLAEVGGRCELTSRPGEGTTVNLSIPLNGKFDLKA